MLPFHALHRSRLESEQNTEDGLEDRKIRMRLGTDHDDAIFTKEGIHHSLSEQHTIRQVLYPCPR